MSLLMIVAVSQHIWLGIICRAADRKCSSRTCFSCSTLSEHVESYTVKVVCIRALISLNSKGWFYTFLFLSMTHILLIAYFYAFLYGLMSTTKESISLVSNSVSLLPPSCHCAKVFECNKNWRAITPYLQV